MRRRLILCLAALLTGGSSPAAWPPEWSQPTQPFHVLGPIYYVGTQGIAVYLLKTRSGLILLDGGLEQSAPIVERNIVALGFRLRDVKLIIATHAHFDHAAAFSALKRDTGAAFASSAADRRAYETGTPKSDVSYGVIRFPPVKVDRVLLDSKPVILGGISMTPLITPGHTPGCTSWSTRVTDEARQLDVVFPCSMSVAGNKLIGNKGYPGIVADFRRTFTRMRTLHADVVLPAHPDLADVLGRAKRRDAGDKAAFVSPEFLPRFVDEAEAAFRAELAKQEAS
jgi:metallo-beta-lactamase class B